MQNKAANLTFPYRAGGTGVATPVRMYTAVAAPGRADALPASWQGKFVIITNVGSNPGDFYLADNSGSTCDPTITATNDGSSSDNTKLGGPLAAGASQQGRLPNVSRTIAASSGGGNAPGGEGAPATLYFVRASTAGTSFKITLAEQ